MSTSSVCQGLQSCLEPGIAEARVLRLKLALPSSTINDSPFDYRPPEPGPPQAARAMMDGLSFLQALASPSPDAAGAAKVYVHPMVKRSASMLSAKSLEMCTESLGSETGSGDETSIMLAMERREGRESSGVSPVVVPTKERAAAARRVNRSASFPPPLASSGGGLKVRPHREDGRLVLRAVAVPPMSSCFHAERADGRLRLRLLNVPRNRDVEGDESGEEEEEIGEEDVGESESEINNGDYEQEEEEEEEDSDEEGGESERNGNVGVKRGKRKLERYSRCKEDGCGNNNRVLLNCNQPYLVAT